MGRLVKEKSSLSKKSQHPQYEKILILNVLRSMFLPKSFLAIHLLSRLLRA
jgi:hypothetical protein